MNESSLGVHQIEFVIESSESLGNGGRVVQHTDGALNFGQVAAGHHSRRLIIDADLRVKRYPLLPNDYNRPGERIRPYRF